MSGQSVVAIDLGASSGRCVLVSLANGRLELEELNRFEHGPKDIDGRQCWDLAYLWDGIQQGLEIGFSQTPDIASVGVDSWAVDFVPVDAQGEALLPFVSYRDARTEGIIPKFLADAGMSDRELFTRTGIQSLELNTLYQLYAVKGDAPKSYERLDRWMLFPDWIHFQLTGVWASEYTNASTTQMLDVHVKDWASDLLDFVGMPGKVMPKIREAGEVLGSVKPSFVSKWAATGDVKVVLPGTHDTASAVAALPSTSRNAYFISLGTWALVGREAPVPDLSHYAYEHGLSNEGGVFATYRQLRNVSGLWLIQNVRQELDPDSHFSEWVTACEEATPAQSIIHPMDDRYFRTPNMALEIQNACRETGQKVPQTKGEFARCIYESLALNFAEVLSDFAKGEQIEELHVVGGGARNQLLCQMIADFSGIPVLAGPFEASALGNAVVQMIGLGWIADLPEARRIIRNSQEIIRCDPQPMPDRDRIRARFDALATPKKGQAS